MLLRTLSLIICILTTSNPALSQELKPFTATYAAKYSGIGVTAIRKLSGRDSNWRLEFNARSLFAEINEYSRFSVDDIRISPGRYEYHKTGLGRDRHTVLNFEPAQQRIVNVSDNSKTIDNAPEKIQDKISYQLQLALDIAAHKNDLRYKIADGKRIREYEFSVSGNETLQTPIGQVETVKVQRVREEDSDRITTIWFAPQWDYALVKLVQREENGKTYQISLTELSIDGKSVNPHQ